VAKLFVIPYNFHCGKCFEILELNLAKGIAIHSLQPHVPDGYKCIHIGLKFPIEQFAREVEAIDEEMNRDKFLIYKGKDLV